MKRVLSLTVILAMMLAIMLTVCAVASSEPQISLSGAEVMLYNEGKTVTIVLNVPTCYGIQGKWSTSAAGNSGIALTDIDTNLTCDILKVGTGEVLWRDATFMNYAQGNVMTATYTVPAGTPDGEYVVTFTSDVFVGEDFEPNDTDVVYSATIRVTNHVCTDSTSDSDHKCDDSQCGKEGVTTCTHASYGKDETNHWSVCACGEIVDGTTTAHVYNDGVCVCGAEEPAPAGVKGDFNGDGEVTAEDLTMLSRHVASIESLPNEDLPFADVDGDGDVDAEDITVHARYVAGIIKEWP